MDLWHLWSQMLEGMDERGDILARLKRADKQNIWHRELIALLRLGNHFSGNIRLELVLYTDIDGLNPLQRYAHLLRNLQTRLIGVGHNARHTPGAWQRQVLPIVEAGARHLLREM